MAITRIGGEKNVNLFIGPGMPARPRDALERGLAGKEATDEAMNARGAAEAEIDHIETTWLDQQALALADGKNPTESPVPAAKAAVAAAQQSLNIHVEAERILGQRLREAVMADRDAWTASAAVDAQTALSELATAIQMAEGARDSLYNNVGVLGTYREFDVNGGAKLAVFHAPKSSKSDIAEGIRHLRDGLNKATRDLDDLAPPKSKKAKSGGSEGAS